MTAKRLGMQQRLAAAPDQVGALIRSGRLRSRAQVCCFGGASRLPRIRSRIVSESQSAFEGSMVLAIAWRWFSGNQ